MATTPVILLPHQSALIRDLTTRHLCIAAGLGSGKTHALVRKHHHLCMVNPRSVSWLSEPTFELIRTVALPAYTDYLSSIGYIEGVHFKVNRSVATLQYVGKNCNHLVHFKSGETWERWVGAEISHYTADEPARTSRKCFERANDRVRCPKAKVLQSVYGGTPDIDLRDDWYYDIFAGKSSARLKQEGKIKVIRARTEDNPFRPKGYIEQLFDSYGHNKNLILCYVFGEFVVLSENLAYDQYSETKNDVNHPPNKNNFTIDMTWDFNVNQTAWTACQLEPTPAGDADYFAVAENERNTPGTYDACIQFMEQFPPYKDAQVAWKNHKIVIHGDASGWQSDTSSTHLFDSDYDLILQTLRPHYREVVVEAPRQNPYIRTRIESTNRGFSKRKLMIHGELTLLKDSLKRTTRDEANKINKPSDDTWSHRSDNLSYWYTYHNPILPISPTERILFQ